LYYESTEKVTDRRLDTNRWNYSICIAILVAVATITQWSLPDERLIWVGLAADFLLCLMAIFFCTLWIGQIRDFKKPKQCQVLSPERNGAHGRHRHRNPGAISSFCPFDKEWKKYREGISALPPFQRRQPMGGVFQRVSHCRQSSSILWISSRAAVAGWTPLGRGRDAIHSRTVRS
jgi:hypothetical protein